MKGVNFNNIHSYRHLNLILSEVSIPPATPKTTYIDVPGADGSLDQTEALGEVKYNNRDCEFLFSVLPTDDFEEKKTEVSNLLNGQVFKITLDKDADYYYQGRCTVDKYKSDKMLRQITVKAKVHPYKFKQSITAVSWAIAKTKNLVEALGEWKLNGDTTVKNNVATISSVGSYIVSNEISLTGVSVLSLSCKTEIASIRTYLRWTDSSGTSTTSTYYLVNGKCENIPVPSGAVKVDVRIYPTSGVFPVVVSNFQVEKSAKCTDYVPKDGFLAVNDRKTVVPTVTVTNNNTTVSINGATTTLAKGTHKILNFQLFEGDNIVNASGSGTVTLKYQEGAL
jgi:phage-related protein